MKKYYFLKQVRADGTSHYHTGQRSATPKLYMLGSLKSVATSKKRYSAKDSKFYAIPLDLSIEGDPIEV